MTTQLKTLNAKRYALSPLLLAQTIRKLHPNPALKILDNLKYFN